MLSYCNAWVTSDPPYIGCTVLVRFDDGEAIKFSVSSAADNSSETIFLNNYSKFVENVKKAKSAGVGWVLEPTHHLLDCTIPRGVKTPPYQIQQA